MASLSKESVMESIQREQKERKGRGEAAEGAGTAVLKRIGGMLRPETSKGGGADRGRYLRYVEEEQSAGRRAKTFEDWAKSS